MPARKLNELGMHSFEVSSTTLAAPGTATPVWAQVDQGMLRTGEAKGVRGLPSSPVLRVLATPSLTLLTCVRGGLSSGGRQRACRGREAEEGGALQPFPDLHQGVVLGSPPAATCSPPTDIGLAGACIKLNPEHAALQALSMHRVASPSRFM